MVKQGVSLVWFKRDFRLTDHLPLQKAIESGDQLILLYCFDPELIEDPHYDVRHWRFVWESLEDMNARIKSHGHRIEVLHAPFREVLLELSKTYHLKSIYSHEESGLKVTYDLDKWVKKFSKEESMFFWIS